jgi:hypothetical protein
MPVEARLEAVRLQVKSRLHAGEAEAAALVMRAVNILPAPLQRAAAGRVGRAGLPQAPVPVPHGGRRRCLLGAPVEQVYPVLALASGIGLAVGVITWRDSMSIGIVADTSLIRDTGGLADEVHRAFRGFEAAAARRAVD